MTDELDRITNRLERIRNDADEATVDLIRAIDEALDAVEKARDEALDGDPAAWGMELVDAWQESIRNRRQEVANFKDRAPQTAEYARGLADGIAACVGDLLARLEPDT